MEKKHIIRFLKERKRGAYTMLVMMYADVRNLEKAYGLTQVAGSREAKERAMTKNELEMMKRTNEPSAKMQLQVLLKDILQQRPNTEQFIKVLEVKDINVQFNQAKTGYVSGISYGYQGFIFKGSRLGQAYKWSNIKNNIQYEQERDRTTIYRANARTQAARPHAGLAGVNGHGKGNTRAAQLSTGQLQKGAVTDSAGSEANVRRSAGRTEKNTNTSLPDKRTGRGKSPSFTAEPQTPSLADVLDRSVGGVLFGAGHPGSSGTASVPLNDEWFKRKKKKKKRKGLRR